MKFKIRGRRYFLLIVSFWGKWKKYDGGVRLIRITKEEYKEPVNDFYTDNC